MIRDGIERVCQELSAGISHFGFNRTKEMFWTRRSLYTIGFIHLHRVGSTRSARTNALVRFRAHFGIRVLNDTFPTATLNGPNSGAPEFRTSGYPLRFNAAIGITYEKCVVDLVRFVVKQGQPWFGQFSNPSSLIDREDSPLGADAKAWLHSAMSGGTVATHVVASPELLGLKNAPLHVAET